MGLEEKLSIFRRNCMTFRMKDHGVLAIALLAGLSLLLAAPAFAQDKPAGKKEAVTEKAKSGPQGADSNIKSDSDKNNPHAQSPAPPEKGGKSRGIGPRPCGIHVDNRTPWIIRVYVDGNYRGAVNSYGDIAGITGDGPTALYAVAIFEDGSTKVWGPHAFICASYDTYSWHLTP
jgi:hypothetical protein